MKIALSGSQNTGKTTYINDFINQWQMYRKPTSSYRDTIKSSKLKINEMSNEDSQQIILDALCKEIIDNKEEKYMIFDRCVIDNLMYTFWLNDEGKVSDDFVKHTIDTVKSHMVYFDLIFIIPLTQHSPIEMEQREMRSDSLMFRQQIDDYFKNYLQLYANQNKTMFPFANKLGCPAIMEMYGDRESRIELTKMYVDENGDFLDDKGFESIIDMAEMHMMQDNLGMTKLPNTKDIKVPDKADWDKLLQK